MNLLENKWFQYFAIGSLFMLMLFLFAESVVTFKQYRFVGSGLEAKNTISVSGRGEVFAVPDIATFTVTVREEAKDAAGAQEGASNKINEVIAYVKGQGVKEKDIKTTDFNLYPRYEWKKDCSTFDIRGACDNKRVLVGYEVSQTIRVKVRDTKKAGQILAGVSAKGADRVSGLSFEIDDKDTLQAQARKKAIEDAKTKARALARDLGVELVRIVSYSDEHNYMEEPQPVFAMRADMKAMGGAIPTAPELPLGENKIQSNVTLVYEIR